MRPVRDSRGVEIRVGQIVAYNRSGDVVEGEVVGVSNSAVRIFAHPDFQQGRNDTKPSRVRNLRSILVLKEAQ